jgi:macrolide transport system ATP-binding/permease protein
MNTFFRKLAWLIERRRKGEQLADELQFHLEEEVEELRQAGLPRNEAQRAARLDLGNVGLVQEDTRAAWGWPLVDQFLQDLRYAARTILRNPGFTLVATLTLALGIGANTAIFSFLDALLMRSLPVADPASLVVLNWHVTGHKRVHDSVIHGASGYFYDDPKTGITTAIFPYPAFELLRRSNDVLSVLLAYCPTEKLNFLARGEAQMLQGEYVSGDYFQGLGVAPAAGRLISPDDDRAGAPAVVVLSYALARSRFGVVASATGQPVVINNLPFTVAGVVHPEFFGVDPASAPDFYLPLHTMPQLSSWRGSKSNPFDDNNYYWVEMMGRMRPGVARAQVQTELGSIFERWVATTATNDVERRNLPEFLLKDGATGLDNLRRTYSEPMYVLWALVGFILAIACANIANLLLARATGRRREMAVRLSMGAGKGRVIRQLLTESLLLAGMGGVAGVLLALWGVQALRALLASGPDGFPLPVDLNWQVLAAAFLLTLLTGMLFGLAPAVQAASVDLQTALKESRLGEQRSPGRYGIRLSRLLVVVQMALSLLLLVAAGLFVRTLEKMRGINLGFRPESLLVFNLDARQAGHTDPEIVGFYGDLEKRFAAIPGARSAAMANSPLVGSGAWGWAVVPLGKPRPEDAPTGHGSGFADSATHVLAIGPGFFSTVHIPMLGGRDFDERDSSRSPAVAIVNEAWVKANLEGQNPVGQQIVSFGGKDEKEARQLEVVGVVGNSRYGPLDGNFPATVYLPCTQKFNYPLAEMTFFLRTAGDPLAYASTVRQIVRQSDARIPVTDLGTQAGQIDQWLRSQILFARLCTGFAVLALAIAGVGLYGTLSYNIARRTGEVGIRMALGAQRRTVVWMVLREVLSLASGGLALGVPIAMATSKLVGSLLYQVKPNDPGALAAAVGMIVSAALVAGFIPAYRASHIDPMDAVRHE